MAFEEQRDNKIDLLLEMADLFQIDFDNYDGEKKYDVNTIIKRLEQENKYSEDLIKEFVHMLYDSGMVYHDPFLNSNDYSEQEEETQHDFSLGENENTFSGGNGLEENGLFSIDSILGNTYSHVKEILYEEYISLKNADIFGNNAMEIANGCDSVNRLVESIDSILSSTSSAVFYTGTEATKNVQNLKTSADNALSMKSSVNKIGEDSILDLIKNYNQKLKEAKNTVRIELLQQKIEEINGKIVSQDSEKYSSSSQKFTGEISVTKVDEVYDYTLTRELVGVNSGLFSKKEYIYLETSVKTIAITPSDDYKQMEKHILKVGEDLPYDRGKVIE